MASSVPLYNVMVPYVGIIDGGFLPGRMVRIQGTVLPNSNRFGINLQCGPNTIPRDDIALHISCRFPENQIVRNTLQNMNWGPEENYGHMPLVRGQGFEIIVLCDPDHFKIAINGQHFTEYPHRIPYNRLTHLAIDGEVTISMISYEGNAASASGFVPPPPVVPGYVPPPAPPMQVPGAMSYPPMPSVYPPPPGPYPPASSPYPPPTGPYPAQPGYGYQQPPYGQAYPPPPPGSAYPPPPPGYNPTHKSSGGILGKAQSAIASVLGPRTGAGGAGLAGAGLGAGLAGAALTGHLSPKKALKSQKKSHKKALKYGLPLAAGAGLGVGAYALSRGFHSGSSSSSSSSSEEE